MCDQSWITGLMTRIRQQMDQLIRNFPFPGSSNETDIAGFPDFSIGGPQFPPIDLGKGNTTSVTKIIDGHKVVINETEYQKQDDFGGSFFKVRIIDVQPDSNETSDEVPATAVTKDREPLENNNSFENEIPKGTEAPTLQKLEQFDETDSPIMSTTDFLDENTLNPTEIDLSGDILVNDMVPSSYSNPDAETIPNLSEFEPIDLSGDIKVNEIAARQGWPLNPDVEFVVGNDGKPIQPGFYHYETAPEDNIETFDEIDGEKESPYRESLAESFEDNSLSTPVETKTVDLSDDTLVNDLLARKMAALNPDAEFIPNSQLYSKVNPRFERLESLDDESKDLSGDTYVNEFASNSGYPINPDAEIIDVNGDSVQGPKYEYS
ncbi:uncharacterized protein LOC109598540 isoform X2 [Aethina tumida]|uniref:uncharacterized protein LOC109598540 isoform X2 n=1 Tax=Aethina tumida TaxID=116153 RepID=UPI002148B84D|nr:uncharacterized protein LOC109598540 isoform X2 [Aethina tumida]